MRIKLYSRFVLFQDLLTCTPSSHPDYPLLQEALRIVQNFLSSINEETTPRRQSMTVKKGEVSVKLSITQAHLVLQMDESTSGLFGSYFL